MKPKLHLTLAPHRSAQALTVLALASGQCLYGSAASAATAPTPADALRLAVARAQAASPAPARLPGLVKNYLRLLKQAPIEGVDEAPEASPGDPGGLAIVLPQVLSTVEQALATAPTAMLGALEAAHTGYAAGLTKLHAGSSDATPQHLVGVLTAMADGQAAMDQALDIAAVIDPPAVTLLLPAVQAAREAARRTSRSTLDLQYRSTTLE